MTSLLYCISKTQFCQELVLGVDGDICNVELVKSKNYGIIIK